MTQENVVIFHLILDEAATKIDSLVKEVEKFSDAQIWRMEGSEICVGKLPKIFKAIPIDKLAYHDGWLTIKMHETSLIRHVFIVCEAKDRLAITEVLKGARRFTPGMRVRIEGEGYEF